MLMKVLRLTAMMLIIPALAASGCRPDPDRAAWRAEIRQLHAETIAAHWEKDVGFFTRDLAEGYFLVNNGEIRHPSTEEIRSRFERYLNNTTFAEYHDLQEPIIGVSRDGSMAWSLVRVKIAGRQVAADGSERALDFICAWISVYERQGDRWLRVGDVSSFE
jgi:hypothetical protein